MVTALILITLVLILICAILVKNAKEESSYYKGIVIYNFDEWYDIYSTQIYDELKDSKDVYRLDFDFEDELHKRYEKYLDDISVIICKRLKDV